MFGNIFKNLLESPSEKALEELIHDSNIRGSISHSIDNINNLKKTLEVLIEEEYPEQIIEVLNKRILDIENLIINFKELYNLEK